jgi:Helix-turn-helix domain
MKRLTLKGDGDKRPFEIYGPYRPAPMYLYERGKYLPADAKLAYIVLISFMNDKLGLCDPSLKTLCERSSLSRVRLVAALNWLQHFGWIIKRRKGFSESNYYELPKPEARKVMKELKAKFHIVELEKQRFEEENRLANAIQEHGLSFYYKPTLKEAKQYAANLKAEARRKRTEREAKKRREEFRVVA